MFFKGLQDASDATIETLKAIDHPISKTAQVLVEACSYSGTGNVLKIQAMLHHCDERLDDKKDEEAKEGEKKDEEKKDDKKEEKKDEKKKDDTYQAFAVIAIALIGMGEEIGSEMSLRQFNHLVCDFLTQRTSMLTESVDALWWPNHSKGRSSRHRSRQCIESTTSHSRYPLQV
jgi:26S proteasome regulatory subunit N1